MLSYIPGLVHADGKKYEERTDGVRACMTSLFMCFFISSGIYVV